MIHMLDVVGQKYYQRVWFRVGFDVSRTYAYGYLPGRRRESVFANQEIMSECTATPHTLMMPPTHSRQCFALCSIVSWTQRRCGTSRLPAFGGRSVHHAVPRRSPRKVSSPRHLSRRFEFLVVVLGAYRLVTETFGAQDPIFLRCPWLTDASFDVSNTAFADDVANKLFVHRPPAEMAGQGREHAREFGRVLAANWRGFN